MFCKTYTRIDLSFQTTCYERHIHSRTLKVDKIFHTSQNGLMTIRSAIESIPEDTGFQYLEDYYLPINSGAHFEAVDAYNNPPDRITGSDLYAVSMLQTPIDGKAGVGILVTEADKVQRLLSNITDEPLGTLSKAQFTEQLGPDSPVKQLWSLLFRQKNVGVTRASKILARKRPHLVPIYDSVVKRVINQQRGDNEWELWWEALTADDYLERRAIALREAIDRPDLSTLRALDVLLWYSGTHGIHSE